MNRFSDFKIEAKTESFSGDKIKINRVFNKEITVKKYKIEPSKFSDKGSGTRLKLQIQIGEAEHIIFTGSRNLMDLIEQVPKENFPFNTIIIDNNDRYEFT
ncbi:MAG TPA: hypothetical protein PK431_01565 [Chitinophagales bacterium]|nr:hypothetical protein [Chitinophagales bacterium]